MHECRRNDRERRMMKMLMIDVKLIDVFAGSFLYQRDPRASYRRWTSAPVRAARSEFSGCTMLLSTVYVGTATGRRPRAVPSRAALVKADAMRLNLNLNLPLKHDEWYVTRRVRCCLCVHACLAAMRW